MGLWHFFGLCFWLVKGCVKGFCLVLWIASLVSSPSRVYGLRHEDGTGSLVLEVGSCARWARDTGWFSALKLLPVAFLLSDFRIASQVSRFKVCLAEEAAR